MLPPIHSANRKGRMEALQMQLGDAGTSRYGAVDLLPWAKLWIRKFTDGIRKTHLVGRWASVGPHR